MIFFFFRKRMYFKTRLLEKKKIEKAFVLKSVTLMHSLTHINTPFASTNRRKLIKYMDDKTKMTTKKRKVLTHPSSKE